MMVNFNMFGLYLVQSDEKKKKKFERMKLVLVANSEMNSKGALIIRRESKCA